MCAYYIKMPEYLPNKLGESMDIGLPWMRF